MKDFFKLNPYISKKLWGEEKWIVSAQEEGQSKENETDTFFSDIVGRDYPLLIKIIEADETLSVQVHPDDEYAEKNENSYGKTECWYILDAKPNATLICGLNKEYSKEELKDAIEKKYIEDCLKEVHVSKGDFIFIPAGTVHAINGGLKILEIQQPSNITYRLYDFERGREIHVDKALDVVKPIHSEPSHDFKSFSCPYFSLNKIDVKNRTLIEKKACSMGYYPLFTISGTGMLTVGGEKAIINKHEVIMIKAELAFSLEPLSDDFSVMQIM